jgi:hypothetical protein
MDMSFKMNASRWFCLVIGLFLLLRATTTLAGGADFGTPGTGWRSVWQLGIVALLALGSVRPRTTAAAVTVVVAIYAVATLLELADGTQLLGVVPVDMRDRWVHPLVAVVGLLCLVGSRPRADPAPAVVT